MPWVIEHGLVESVLPTLPSESFDGVFCDPPYNLSTEGWDDFGRQRAYQSRGEGYGNKGKIKGYGRGGTPQDRESFRRKSNLAFQGWVTQWATEALRVVKPGAWLIAFGSPRTVHRLAAGVEDAGWEIRDSLPWVHDGGVPKNRRTELLPTHEPVVLARRPLAESTVLRNVEKWGVGDLRTDGNQHPANVIHCPKPSALERAESTHPTPKPVILCRDLAQVILPASRCGRLLVPFSGSGSEIVGAIQAGWGDGVGVEQTLPYVETARRRIARLAGVAAPASGTVFDLMMDLCDDASH